VRIDGLPVALASPADARRRGVAMVYQDTRLVPDLDSRPEHLSRAASRAGS